MKEMGLLLLGSKKYGEISAYDVEIFPKTIKYKYSKVQGFSWTKPGQVCAIIEDNGEGYIFTSYDINMNVETEIFLDKYQAEILRAMLKTMDKSGSTYEYIKRTIS